MNFLERIDLSGYKSIKDMSLELRQLNVLIGANGSGKSNFVSFFKLLNEMMGERLQLFIGASGAAHSILHYGTKVTQQITCKLHFDADGAKDIYSMRLFYAAVDTLIFAEEQLEYKLRAANHFQDPIHLGSGHRETELTSKAEEGDPRARVFRHLLNMCRVYHFYDTSSESQIRQAAYIEDDRFLYPNAKNLPAFLYKLKLAEEPYYRRIVGTIKQIMPFFSDFVLEPRSVNEKDIILNWQNTHSDYLFGPHQLPDGGLRAIALVTLLLQPTGNLPSLIVVDEPELGLHPNAISVVAALLKQASLHCQIIIATQSPTLLDEFDPEDVIVVDREPDKSVFVRHDPEKLRDWLKDYSLGELWQKNVLGGGPMV
jgi:predicted ATPase